jgi:hypothetical protein
MFTLQYAKDPIFSSAEGTSIILTVKWEEFTEEMPFTATSHEWDTPHGKDVFVRAVAGEFGEVAPYVPPVPVPPTAEKNKQTAISKLQATDWAATVDIANSEYSNPYLTNQDAFLTYRNQIREYAVNPIAGDISWPSEPTAIWSNA